MSAPNYTDEEWNELISYLQMCQVGGLLRQMLALLIEEVVGDLESAEVMAHEMVTQSFDNFREKFEKPLETVNAPEKTKPEKPS